MSTISLAATARAKDPTAKALRKTGQVPCVLYGFETENTSLQCEWRELKKVYIQAGESTLVELDAAGKKIPVLFHSIDFDPVSDEIEHVDFFAVNMKKEVTASVPLSFVGESPAVKDLGGVLLTPHDHVTVKCLPTVLPSSLEVSIESLVDFTSSLHVSDIATPDGVVIEDDGEIVIALVQEPRKEAEPESAAADEAEGEGDTAAAEGGEEKKEGEGDNASDDK